MAKPLTNELREKIIIHKQNTVKEDDIAKYLIISKSAVTKIWKLFCESGSWEPLPQNAGRKPVIDSDGLNKIKEKIHEEPDITLQELIDELSLGVSQSALCRTLQKMDLSFKKKLCSRQISSVKMFKKNEKNGKKVRNN